MSFHRIPLAEDVGLDTGLHLWRWVGFAGNIGGEVVIDILWGFTESSGEFLDPCLVLLRFCGFRAFCSIRGICVVSLEI